jgi:hypothetical protein
MKIIEKQKEIGAIIIPPIRPNPRDFLLDMKLQTITPI